jgi:hypothetical protein
MEILKKNFESGIFFCMIEQETFFQSTSSEDEEEERKKGKMQDVKLISL